MHAIANDGRRQGAHCLLNTLLMTYPDLSDCIAFYNQISAETGKPPTRADIDPTRFGRCLGRVLLVECHDGSGDTRSSRNGVGGRVRIRLAGGKINALLERELTGAFFDEIACLTNDLDHCAASTNDDHFGVSQRDNPSYGHHSFLLNDGFTVSFERLTLPLSLIADEPPMAVVIMLAMTVRRTDASLRNLDQIRSPLWVDR